MKRVLSLLSLPILGLALLWVGLGALDALDPEAEAVPDAAAIQTLIDSHGGPAQVKLVPHAQAFQGALPARNQARGIARGEILSARIQQAVESGSGEALSLPLVFVRAGKSALAPAQPPVPTDAPSEPEPTEPAPSEPTAAPPEPDHTYWKDAYSVMTQECATCHYAGGIGPFALESYEQAKDQADMIRWAVAEGIMPPLPADPTTGAPFDDPRIMSEEDRQTLIDWVDEGAHEGDPADKPDIAPPDREPYGEPSLVLDIGVDYSPPENELDDYRCFVIDPGFRRDTEIRMVDLQQTSFEMFHHGILYLAEPGDVSAVERMDRADPGPGYSCFGGPGFNAGPWVTGEAVGGVVSPYPAGTAKVIPARSVFVLQLHYNTLNGIHTDRTQVKIWQAERPVNNPPRDYYLINPIFSIPAGKKEHSATGRLDIARGGRGGGPGGLFPRAEPGWLWRVWGHMHLLGSKFDLTLIRADGSRERVLDIPEWDFNWQGSYDLIDPIKLEVGDRIEMTCTWDNSPENQPYLDGRQVSPRRVGWGEGTLDEMCLGGVTITD